MSDGYVGSFANAITSQRSYGATKSNQQSVMLTVIESKVLTHKLQPSDTLQGLAIKYGVTIEKLKRINKLWSNEHIYVKDTIQIPCNSSNKVDNNHLMESCDSLSNVNAQKTLQERKPEQDNCLKNNSCKDFANVDLNSSWKENEEQLASQEHSEAFKSFNEMLSKIDGQIQTHKHQNHNTAPDHMPVVGYDSYQSGSGQTSPTKQSLFLEQGT